MTKKILKGKVIKDKNNKTMILGSENIIKNIPLKRLGKTEDIGQLVAFLSSEVSSYITGQVINIDGGMLM